MQYGKYVVGKLEPIPLELGDRMTKPGEIYEIEINTKGIEDETAAITKLLESEKYNSDLEILYVETDVQTGKIKIQVTDLGPEDWSLVGFLGSLPTLMILGGIVILGYYLWQIVKPESMNQWLIILLATGGIGVIAFMAFKDKIPTPGAIHTRKDAGTKSGEKVARIEAEEKEKEARRSVQTRLINSLEKRLEAQKGQLQHYKTSGPPSKEKKMEREIRKTEAEIDLAFEKLAAI